MHNLRKYLPALLIFGAVQAAMGSQVLRAQVIAEDTVLWSSPDFTITVWDLKMYLKPPVSEEGVLLWGTGDQVRRALQDLYVLNVLAVEAERAEVLTPEQRRWIVDYQLKMKSAERLLYLRAMEMMESVDWQQAAREYFIAHREEFVEPETRRVRTLLLTTEARTLEQAQALARDVAPPTLSEEAFKSVVVEYSEDPAGGDGLMDGLIRGQTVPEFEEAAFALGEIGDISEPVISMFGVHVIQLLDLRPERRKPFEEVGEALVEELKEKRWAEFNTLLRDEPKRTPPAGLVENKEQLEALIQLADDQTRQSKTDERSVLIMEDR